MPTGFASPSPRHAAAPDRSSRILPTTSITSTTSYSASTTATASGQDQRGRLGNSFLPARLGAVPVRPARASTARRDPNLETGGPLQQRFHFNRMTQNRRQRATAPSRTASSPSTPVGTTAIAARAPRSSSLSSPLISTQRHSRWPRRRRVPDSFGYPPSTVTPTLRSAPSAQTWRVHKEENINACSTRGTAPLMIERYECPP